MRGLVVEVKMTNGEIIMFQGEDAKRAEDVFWEGARSGGWFTTNDHAIQIAHVNSVKRKVRNV